LIFSIHPSAFILQLAAFGLQTNRQTKKDRDDLTLKNDAFMKDKASIKTELIKVIKDKGDIEQQLESLQKKYSEITSKLRDQVECPVCLEVPTVGPIHVCPNGHFVCSKCKEANCPTCRSRMFNGKSLLAVTVIENIDHKCKFEGCHELLPLQEYQEHLQCCPQRIVHCPSPREFCGKAMALSKVYEHIMDECQGSFNSRAKDTLKNDDFPKFLEYDSGLGERKSIPGFALCWKGVYFYLSFEKMAQCCMFSVQHLGNALECKDYVVSLVVHRSDEEDLKGAHMIKLSGEPFPIDMDPTTRNANGLIVGSLLMEKLVSKDNNGVGRVGITIDISRNINEV
jgi:hypothetical protein